MWASIKNADEEIVTLYLDAEAARAVFASMIFAARLHRAIAPLIAVAERGLEGTWHHAQEGESVCR